jgi:hypothetical protein
MPFRVMVDDRYQMSGTAVVVSVLNARLSAPSNLVASASGSGIVLTWSAPPATAPLR